MKWVGAMIDTIVGAVSSGSVSWLNGKTFFDWSLLELSCSLWIDFGCDLGRIRFAGFGGHGIPLVSSEVIEFHWFFWRL